MALIECPECKNKISTLSEACPNCGYPIKGNELAATNTENNAAKPVVPKKPLNKKLLVVILASAAVLLVAVVALLLLLPSSDTETPTSTEELVTQEVDTLNAPDTEEPFSVPCGSYLGNAYIEISLLDSEYYYLFYTVGNESGTRTASIEHYFYQSDLLGNTLTFAFTDSWGNEGEMALVFEDGAIHANITISTYSSSALFSVTDGEDMLYPDTFTEEAFLEPEEAAPETSIPAGIQIGDVYFDDVEALLPISMDQVRQDIISRKHDRFSLGGKLLQYDIAYLMPIKGRYTGDYDRYEVYLHAYFTHGSNHIDKQFTYTYRLNDIGGWTYDTHSEHKEIQTNRVLSNPFCPKGGKSGDFPYDSYPEGLPISLGELADDILYADLAYIEIEGFHEAFDISAIDIISGNYTSDNTMSLQVEIYYENDTHTGTIKANLPYTYYDAGGWEISKNYYDYSGSDFVSKRFQPKTVDFSDKPFLATAKKTFTQITPVNTQDSTLDNGQPVRTITYDAVRETPYLKEYYKVELTATFHFTTWSERVNIKLVDADYSGMMGLWEYRVGDEYLRVRVKDAAFACNGDGWERHKSTATITCDFESSSWGTEAYTEENLVREISIVGAVFGYANEPNHMDVHEDDCFAYLSEHAGAFSAGGKDVSIYLDRQSGVVLAEYSAKALGFTELAFTKIS